MTAATAAAPTGTRALAAGVVMAITMNAFEAMSVATAMPAVAEDLGGDALYGAAFSAYMLANLISIVAAGEQADRRGPARPFIGAILVFAAGLVVAGLAPTMLVVVIGRALQGAGAGALASVAYVAVGRAVADRAGGGRVPERAVQLALGVPRLAAAVARARRPGAAGAHRPRFAGA